MQNNKIKNYTIGIIIIIVVSLVIYYLFTNFFPVNNISNLPVNRQAAQILNNQEKVDVLMKLGNSSSTIKLTDIQRSSILKKLSTSDQKIFAEMTQEQKIKVLESLIKK